MNRSRVSLRVAVLLLCSLPFASEILARPAIDVDTELAPPAWALAQRALLRANVDAALVATEKYVNVRGWTRITPNWGAMDGPDDVMETFRHWPLLYMLGAPSKILTLYKKIWEGHLDQFTAAREPLVDPAKDGMYYKEFCPSLDWEHTGEGMAAWYWYGLGRPEDPQYLTRARRFAGFYMNEDPEALNYDPTHKLIRSLFNGSRGPLLTVATEAHWGGPPRPRHDPRPGQLPRTERWTRLGYVVSLRGDHPQNMLTTNLALTAHLLTGEAKYRDWILEYVNAWVERAEQNGGNLPSNIGLDGTIGGEWDGEWWRGVYGWNFRPKNDDGTENPDNNCIMRGARIGFGIAFLLTKDQRYVDTLRKQIDNMYAQGKVIDGEFQTPNKYDGNRWYGYTPLSRTREGNTNFGSLPELIDIFLWTMKDSDLPRIATDYWIRYLQGEDPGYPYRALSDDHEMIRQKVARLRQDVKTTDTRASSELQDPTSLYSLLNLMLGANYPGGGGNVLHAQVRYFDPGRRRPGLPPDVGALVEKIEPGGITLTLVNLDPVRGRELIVQTGAYSEHKATAVTVDGRRIAVEDTHFKVRLGPGSGARLTIEMQRFVNQPTMAFPWDRE